MDRQGGGGTGQIFHMAKLFLRRLDTSLKGLGHEIFDFRFLFMNHFPSGPGPSINAISNIFLNTGTYS